MSSVKQLYIRFLWKWSCVTLLLALLTGIIRTALPPTYLHDGMWLSMGFLALLTAALYAMGLKGISRKRHGAFMYWLMGTLMAKFLGAFFAVFTYLLYSNLDKSALQAVIIAFLLYYVAFTALLVTGLVRNISRFTPPAGSNNTSYHANN